MPVYASREWIQLSAIFLIVVFLESGCVVSQKYVVSVPDIKGNGLSLVQPPIVQGSELFLEFTRPDILYARAEAKNNIIQLDGLRLSVKPFNARLVSTFNTGFFFIPLPITGAYPEPQRFGKKDKLANPPFIIEIAFKTETGPLSVNPAEITLSVSGRDYKPTRMIPPLDFPPMLKFGSLRFQGLSLCFLSHDMKLEASLKPIEPILLNGEFCIWLSFDIPPPLPETEYFVSIHGVKMNMSGLSVQIPTIRFVQGIAYYNDSMP
jgi:hypothetical protein